MSTGAMAGGPFHHGSAIGIGPVGPSSGMMPNQGVVLPHHSHSFTGMQKPEPTSDTLIRMIAMRMRWFDQLFSFPAPFNEFFTAHKCRDEVHIFTIVDGKPVTFTEPWDLFPSDGFITQLRLLERPNG